MFVDALKGQIQPHLERNTGRSRALLSALTKHHKPSNNKAYRAIWGALWYAVEQGWLRRRSGRYIGVNSTYSGSHSWLLRSSIGDIGKPKSSDSITLARW